MQLFGIRFGQSTTAGLAVDEALLASAMIGSIGVFAAVTVPWETVFGTHASAALTQLEQIEQANTAFYMAYSRWPYQMTNGFPNNNAAVLVTPRVMQQPFLSGVAYEPFLTGVPFDVQSTGIVLRHAYGDGGVIVQRRSPRRDYEMEIVLQNVPHEILQGIDERVDGEPGLDTGRVRSEVVGNRIDLVYLANPVARRSVRR